MNGEKLRTAFIKLLCNRIFESSFGKKTLKLNDEVENAIELICQYLNNEVEFEKNKSYSLKKGLFLYGNCGSGKTELLRTYQDFKIKVFDETVGFKTCKDMNTAYKHIDSDTRKAQKLIGIKTFASKNDKTERIFDEFGAEEPFIIDFGNRFAVMPYIFEERYSGITDGVVTHSTSNLTRNSIKEVYGNRIDSRLDAMFNTIVLGKTSGGFDFRK